MSVDRATAEVPDLGREGRTWRSGPPGTAPPRRRSAGRRSGPRTRSGSGASIPWARSVAILSRPGVVGSGGRRPVGAPGARSARTRRPGTSGRGSGRRAGCRPPAARGRWPTPAPGRRGRRRRPGSGCPTANDRGVDLGPPHQLGHLGEVVGHPFADPPAGSTVDQDEERGAGHLVVAPGLGGHDDRQTRCGLWPRTSAGISISGPLVTTTSRSPVGQAELVAVAGRPSRTRHRSRTPTTGRPAA